MHSLPTCTHTHKTNLSTITPKLIQAHSLFSGWTSVYITGLAFFPCCSCGYALTGKLIHACEHMTSLMANCHSISIDGKTEESIQKPRYCMTMWQKWLERERNVYVFMWSGLQNESLRLTVMCQGRRQIQFTLWRSWRECWCWLPAAAPWLPWKKKNDRMVGSEDGNKEGHTRKERKENVNTSHRLLINCRMCAALWCSSNRP